MILLQCLGAVRGKYADRYRPQGANIVKLDDDVSAIFPDAKAVNDASAPSFGWRKTRLNTPDPLSQCLTMTFSLRLRN